MISRRTTVGPQLGVLGWTPRFGFPQVLESLRSGHDWRSPLIHTIGIKGYHDGAFRDGLYPVTGRSDPPATSETV